MPPAPAAGGPLRLALVCPYSLSRPGGVQGQVTGLAGAYRRHGHEVTVFAPLDGGAVLPADVDIVRIGRSVPVPANGSVAPVSLSPVAVHRGLRELRSRGIDVVHVHEPFAPGMSTELLVSRAVPPLVATFHRSGMGLLYGAMGPVTRRLGRRLAARCAVSSEARATAARVVDGEIEVLFNGVDTDRYRDVVPWPKNRTAVLFLGRHEERKGLSVLLEAFDRLRRHEPAPVPELWVAGAGPATGDLRRRWSPDADIRWLGYISEEEKIRRLVAADVICAPSLGQESFGVVLLEAMAARTVVVASDLPGYRDAADSCAVLVPPDEPDELAEALGGVLSGRLGVDGAAVDGAAVDGAAVDGADGQTAGRRRWLDQAHGWAEAFSMEHLAERYETIFARVLQGSAR